MDIANWQLWLFFSIFVILILSFDTFLLSKKFVRPNQSVRAAVYWTIAWVMLALVFNCLLWFYVFCNFNITLANEVGLDFFTGYLIEKTLAFDNLFVFYVIFAQFKIPVTYQQRVFSYGIWSAIVLRLLFILLGVWLITRFHWVFYFMGAFLLFTGVKLFFVHEKNFNDSRVTKFLLRTFRVTPELHQEHFFVRINQLLYVTPLFIALIFIEISDIIFAIDSIPAIFAITTDPFIVWSSNIFAILGLRALYFLLAGFVTAFRLLKYGIALILIFVGSKMLIGHWMKISALMSLVIIILILLIFTFLSMLEKKLRKN